MDRWIVTFTSKELRKRYNILLLKADYLIRIRKEILLGNLNSSLIMIILFNIGLSNLHRLPSSADKIY